MTVTQILLSAIRAQVCGGESVPLDGMQESAYASLYRLSKAHDMAHVVAAELDAQDVCASGGEIGQNFSKQQLLAVFRYEQQSFELEQICELFEREHIPHMPLKGSVIRKYYSEPWMRTSSDIDILVHQADLERATQALIDEQGYSIYLRSEHDVSMFAPSGVHVELHFDLIEDERANNCSDILRDVWSYARVAEGSEYRYGMSDEMFYFYHVAHMAKHMEIGGCGIKPFIDTWILEHSVEHDRAARDALLQKGELLVFANACRALSEVWFSSQEHTDITRDFENFVLRGGVYGSVDNRVAAQQGKQSSRLAYMLSRIIMPYDTLKHQYPVLLKHKWLLPVCQVRRWFRLVFRAGRLGTSVGELKRSASISAQDVNVWQTRVPV